MARKKANAKTQLTVTLPGMLEIDSNRGVIWFHLDPAADKALAQQYEKLTLTPLRICGLPAPIPPTIFMDITIGVGCNWGTGALDEEQ